MSFHDDLLPFEYCSLDESRQEIRLIKLCPPREPPEADFIECGMEVVFLNNNFEYCALSYVWGDPTPTNKLVIKGDTEPRTLSITANLFEALQAIQALQALQRSPYGTDTYFWIDAVCINQEDYIEKSWHVARMKTVFEQANYVTAWFGVPTEEDKDFFPAVLVCYEFLIDIWHPDIQALDPKSRDDHANRKTQEFKDLHKNEPRHVLFICGNILCPLERLQRVFNAIYGALVFRKVEDFRAADRAQTPFEEISIRYFEKAINLQERTQKNDHTAIVTSFTPIFYIFYMREQFKKNNQAYSLWDLLAFKRKANIKSTDPRDNIYALLGLANDAKILDIQVDYTITPQTCFIQTCKALMRQGYFSKVLWFATKLKLLKGLPSWVPDFSPSNDLWRLNLETFEFYSYPGVFESGLYSNLSFGFNTINSQELLVLRGSVFHRVQDVSEVFLEPCDMIAGLRIAFNIVSNMIRESACQINFNGQDIVSTLLHGRHIEHLTHEESDDTSSGSQGYRVGSKLGTYWLIKLVEYVTDTSKVIDNELLQSCGFLMAMRTTRLQSQRAFITANGTLGIGSGTLRSGDIVAIFHGIEIPYILRRDETSVEAYNLIGSAYVDGLMYGEAKDMKLEECDFHIH